MPFMVRNTSTIVRSDAPQLPDTTAPGVSQVIRRARQCKDILHYIPQNITRASSDGADHHEELVYDRIERRWKLVQAGDLLKYFHDN